MQAMNSLHSALSFMHLKDEVVRQTQWGSVQLALDVSHHREDVRPACKLVVYQSGCCRSQLGMPAHGSSGNARAGIGAQ